MGKKTKADLQEELAAEKALTEELTAKLEALKADVFEDEPANDPDAELEVEQEVFLSVAPAPTAENIGDFLVTAEDTLDEVATVLAAKFMIFFGMACQAGEAEELYFDDALLTCFASPEIAKKVADRLEEILLPEFKRNGKICVVMADPMWIQRLGFDERYEFTVLIQDDPELAAVEIEVLTDADEDDVVADRLDDGVAMIFSGNLLKKAAAGTLAVMVTDNGKTVSVDVTSTDPVPTGKA